MGLDVYVGTLTRYYAKEWESVVQRAARESGVPVTIIRPEGDSEDAVTDPAAIEEVIVEWREALSASLKTHLTAPLDWTEGMDPPYFTDKPAWDCYSALMVWAAHEEHGDPRLPTVSPEDWTSNTAVQRSQADDFRSRYGQLLNGPELWLPGDFTFTFSAEDATGNEVTIGSVASLSGQLQELNRRTWRADATTIGNWRRAGADFGAPFEVSARFGFAVFAELADEAARHRLPMKLDY